jgi:hypothetical protein
MGGFNKALSERKKLWVPKSQIGGGLKRKRRHKNSNSYSKDAAPENKPRCAKEVISKRVKKIW